MAANFFKIFKGVNLNPRSDQPTSPSVGDMYFDDGTSRTPGLYQYKAGAWSIAGSGGSGASQLDPDQESAFLYYTRSDFSIEKDALIASVTGATNSIVGTGKVSFSAAGQIVTSIKISGAQITADAIPAIVVRAKLLYTNGKVDNPTVQFSRDGGSNYFTATTSLLNSAGNIVVSSITFTDTDPVTTDLRIKITSGTNSNAGGGTELLGFGVDYALDTTLTITGDSSFERRVLTSTEASTGLITLSAVRYTPGTHQLMANNGGHVYLAGDFTELNTTQVQFPANFFLTGDIVRFSNAFGLVDGTSQALGKLNLVYDAIVGSSAQVSSGIAQYSTIASAIAGVPSNGKILVLRGTYVENLTINNNVHIEGQGYGSQLTGTVTFGSSSDYSSFRMMRISDNISFSSGADGIVMRDCWQATSKTITNSGMANSILVIQE